MFVTHHWMPMTRTSAGMLLGDLIAIAAQGQTVRKSQHTAHMGIPKSKWDLVESQSLGARRLVAAQSIIATGRLLLAMIKASADTTTGPTTASVAGGRTLQPRQAIARMGIEGNSWELVHLAVGGA